MSEQNTNKNFDFLRNIIREKSTLPSKADLSKIAHIIQEQIPKAVEQVAPPNFHILFDDFEAEYEKLKDYILYDKLLGKNIVALGGGFSSGKSSFLNSLMTKGNDILPVDNSASTSVPTYIVSGSGFALTGLNVFDAKFSVDEVTMLTKIAHGFGKSEANTADAVTLGHIVESLFFETKLHHFEHIAFLDTPGYSKADSVDYSIKTDEAIARRQLNMANYILWFIPANAGIITQNDIDFLKSINENIPKLFILNKCDLKPPADIEQIIEKIKDTLQIKGISFVDVLAYSRNNREGFDSEKIKNHFNAWNTINTKNNFAINFKKLFTQCETYYNEQLKLEQKQLRSLNIAATLSEDAEVGDSISLVLKLTKNTIDNLENVKESLHNLKVDFFTELKKVGENIGIEMPEPSKLDLISDKAQSPFDVVKSYMAKNKIQPNNKILDIMEAAFENVEPKINKMIGGIDYREVILKELEALNDFKGEVKI